MPDNGTECIAGATWKIKKIGRACKKWEKMQSESESYVANDRVKDEKIRWFTKISMRLFLTIASWSNNLLIFTIHCEGIDNLQCWQYLWKLFISKG